MVQVRVLGDQIRQLQARMDEGERSGGKQLQRDPDDATRADDAWSEKMHSTEEGITSQTSTTASKPNASILESATLLQRK